MSVYMRAFVRVSTCVCEYVCMSVSMCVCVFSCVKSTMRHENTNIKLSQGAQHEYQKQNTNIKLSQ
jgi:hypothetical protein